MTQALWYAFNCPLTHYTGVKAAKQGITSHYEVRLGVYQNSYSRDNHTACFEMAYLGDPVAIKNLESAVKREYNWAIERDGRGHTEWISGINVEEIQEKIDVIIKSGHYKVTKVDPNFLPLTTDNMEEFLEFYQLRKKL